MKELNEHLNGNGPMNGHNGNHNGFHRNGLTVIDELEDGHENYSVETPLRENAFDLNDSEKKELIAEKFGEIMEILGLDLKDDSLRDTPKRVAKMFVEEVFYGLDPLKKPSAKLFENKYRYGQMLVEKGITVHSYCEHHFVPILGKAHVAYISNGYVIGLSKINRIVKYFAKRPQVQERLTEQIADELKKVLKTEDVAVYIDAEHLCVSTRGIEDTGSSTVTSHFGGRFQEQRMQEQFLKFID